MEGDGGAELEEKVNASINPSRLSRHGAFIGPRAVPVRITTVYTGETCTLRVDGRLVGDDIAELVQAREGLRGPPVLDLHGLQFVDGRAASVLRDLQARGATFVGASPYIRLLLGQPATDDDAREP